MSRHKSCCTTQQIIMWDASGRGHFFISRNSTINGFRLPSNKIPTSQHWKPPSCTEPSHWLHLLWSKHGQSSSQLVSGWWVLVLGMSLGGRGAVEGQMPTHPDISPDTCLPAWGHKATPHTSSNTRLPAQGCEVAPKTPFTTCHTGDAASGAAAPGRRLRCLRETKLPQHESETQHSHKEQLWKTPAAPSLMSLYILSVTYRKQNGLAELSEGVRL